MTELIVELPKAYSCLRQGAVVGVLAAVRKRCAPIGRNGDGAATWAVPT
jgi:hypothetical protein